MRLRVATALLLALTVADYAAASDPLVAALKQLGKAVDDMSANISNANSDADAEVLANVTRQALGNGLRQDHPDVIIKATAGYCLVTIDTPKWKLWSESHHGKVTEHGATIH
jgi:hypothetical protein